MAYYSYTSAIYIGNGLNTSVIYIGQGLSRISENILHYIYRPDNEIFDCPSIKCGNEHSSNLQNIEYISPAPSAPPLQMLQNTYKEYIMVEKEDLIKLIRENGNIELYNKYIIVQ